MLDHKFSVWRESDVSNFIYIAAPGTIKSHTKFEATAYISTKEKGGRHTPFGGSEKEGKKTKSGKEYRPQFYFLTRLNDPLSSIKFSSSDLLNFFFHNFIWHTN